MGGIMYQDNAAVSAPHGLDGAMPYSRSLPFRAYGYQKRFIDDYLTTRLYDLTDDNRAVVAEGIEQYEGGEVVLPGELVVFLDELFRANRF